MRRFAHIAKRVLFWMFAGTLTLVAGVIIALQFKPVRSFAVQHALAAVRGSLKGDLYIDDVRWPSFGQIELSGVSLFDRDGRPVLTLPSLIVRIRLGELLHQRVQIDRVELDHPYVEFADFGDEEGLLSVFGSDEPKPAEPKAKNSDFSPIPVQIDQLCIEAGQVGLAPDEARQLLLHRIQGCARLHMGYNLTVALDQLRAQVQNRGQDVLEIVPRKDLEQLSNLAANGGKGEGPTRVGLAGKFSMREAMSYDAYLDIRQLTAASLNGLGVDASWLHAPLNADAHAYSPGEAIRFRLEALAKTSLVRLHGEWTDAKQLQAQIESEHLELQPFGVDGIEPLAFSLDARGDFSRPSALGLQAELKRARMGGVPLPEISVKAERLASGAVDVAALSARQGDSHIEAQGRLEADGGMRAQADLVLPALEKLPVAKLGKLDASGGLSGHLQFQRAATGTILAEASLSGRSLQLQNNVVSELELRAHASGAPQHPKLDVTLDARQLTLGAQQIPAAHLRLAGGPDRYDLSARADNRGLALDGWVAVDNPGYRGGFQLQAELDNEPLHASLDQVAFVPGDHLQIEKLRADYAGARLFADGRMELVDAKKQGRIRFGAAVPELAKLSQQFMQKAIPGRIEAVGELHGRLDQPALETRIRWMNGPALGKYASEFALYAKADMAEGRASAKLQASAGHAKAVADLDSRWQRDLPLSAALERAHHELHLNTRSLPIEQLASAGSDHAPMDLRGLLSGELTAKGNAKKLELDTRWQAEVRAARDPSALGLHFEGKYKDAKLELGLTADDQQGRLLDFKAAQSVNVEQLATKKKPLDELVMGTPWETHAKFEKRRLRELPLLRGLGLDRELTPITVATTLDIEHTPDQEPKGAWKTELDWEPASAQRAEIAPCSANAASKLVFSGKLEDGQLGLEGLLHSGDQDVARITSGLHTRVRDMLQNRFDHVGPTGVTVEVTKLDLSQIPLMCERGSGVVDARLTGKDLFAPAADFKLQLSAAGMVWDESDPLSLDANANSDGDKLAVRARFQTGAGGELRVDGALPIGFRGKDPLLIVNRAGPVALATKFNNVNLAALLAYAPGVARSSGRVAGEIDVKGTLQKPQVNGQLQLEDVSFTLPRLGQRFSHLNMKAALNGNTLRLSDGKFRDLDGSASIAAQLTFDRPDAWSAELNLNVRNFPVRKSGVMMGRADANVKAVAKSTPKEMTVVITLTEVAIQLTSSDMGDVQSLDPNPEIQFTDALSTKPTPKPTDEGEQTTTSAPTVIMIETPDAIWVRRDDFAVQMKTKLKITLGEEHPDMRGTIDLLRGYLSVLGQNFDIKRGRVTFTGGEKVDPQLEITAENTTSGGAKIVLEVTGFVQAPKLAFTKDGQSVTAGEAITAMTGHGSSGGSDQGFQDQIASAAIGMTTGLLTLGARREFGDWVPMLSVEPGTQTRVRVGVEADRFIPNFMRGFVHGAYVEGIVSSGQNASQDTTAGAETNTASGTGVLLELMLPKSLVWAGQYGPGAAWSVDLDWRP